MKLRKTPLWQRDVYIYHFENGDKSIVSVGKVIDYHNGICTVFYDSSITAETIKSLHKADDKEVRENVKAITFEDYTMRNERLINKKKWDIEHPDKLNPYDKPPKVIRLESITSNATLDEIDNFLYQNLDEDNDSIELERIESQRKLVEDFVKTLNSRMQELYDLLYIQGLNQNQISKKLNLTRSTVSTRKKWLDRKIFKKFSK